MHRMVVKYRLLNFVKMFSSVKKDLPLFISSTVVHGFGRGSKDLGVPTANFEFSVVEKLPDTLSCGIYFGWSQVNSGPIYKMVTSVGWNPYFKNEKKSMEVHILHKFENDFYGALLKACVVGYIRPEKSFSSLDELISEINNDIRIANESLELPEYKKYLNNDFWTCANNHHQDS